MIVPDFRARSWCDLVVSAMDRATWSDAEIVDAGYRVNQAVRRVREAEVCGDTLREVEAAIEDARRRAEAFFGLRLDGNEAPRVLRYVSGGVYRRHRDCIDDQAATFPRVISVVLFLSTAGEGDGGVLRLHGVDGAHVSAPLDVRPNAGTLVAFPSGWLHEVLPVTGGVRDVVVDWLA